MYRLKNAPVSSKTAVANQEEGPGMNKKYLYKMFIYRCMHLYSYVS